MTDKRVAELEARVASLVSVVQSALIRVHMYPGDGHPMTGSETMMRQALTAEELERVQFITRNSR